MSNISPILLAVVLLFGACSEKEASLPGTGGKPLFTLLSPAETGIDFVNALHDDPTTDWNVLSYQYFYNGAGVAVGDIDNDGLSDLFFAANEEPNRLYRNKGNLQFEDITEKAGVNQGKKWSTGATMADVNADGFLDIYVGQAGPYKDAKDRKNLLFINNGDGTFSEKAEEYGLADGNYTTQAAFFDYDKDGDLDCYVLNESKYAGVIFQTVFEDLKKKENMDAASGHLYRNDGGKFTKVTEQAGVLRYGYGLGLVVNDIDQDGWTDIYVANDYSVPDFMFINNGDGTFTDRIKEKTRQVSFFAMGCDIADINNDCLPEIAVVDMAAKDHFKDKTLMASMDIQGFWFFVETMGYQYQYMFNSLQLNNGNGSFSNIAALSGLLRSDWSWAAVLADFDLDGYKDYYISNGFRRYSRDNDFRREMAAIRDANGGTVPLNMREEVYKKMPEVIDPNFMFKNNGDLTFSDVSQPWGLAQPNYSNGCAYADLDNDGDLELILNNIDQEAFVYKNLAVEQKKGNFLTLQLKPKKTGASAFNARVTLYYGDHKRQYQEFHPVRGYEGSMDHYLHFGMESVSKVDKIRVEWLDGDVQEWKDVATNQRLTLDQSQGTAAGAETAEKVSPPFREVDMNALKVNFRHVENAFDDFAKEVLLPHRQSTLGPGLAAGDINGDGLDDFYIGGAAGQSGVLYVQQADGTFLVNEHQPWAMDAAAEDMGALFFDAEGDGDPDLYVVSGGGGEMEAKPELLQDRLYINLDGKGRFAKVNALPAMQSAGSIVKASDFDGDGDLDLFVGGGAVPGKYPYPSRSHLLRNDNKKFTDVTQEYAPDLMTPGMVKDAVFTDLNGDKSADLVLVGEWMPVSVYLNDKGKFRDATSEYGLENLKGWWYSIAAADLDGDGDQDFVLGNLGKNAKFYASREKPFNVFAGDFDKNNTCDIVLSKEYNGKLVPARGRQCSSEQMPFIKQKFPTYKDFASADLEDILGEKNLEEALHLEVTTFGSMMLINEGNGKFSEKYLPNLAQISPIKRIIAEDFNGDGQLDLLLVGNMYEAEVETPRYDAGNGLLMLGDGKGNFEPQPITRSGFFAPKNAKDMALLRTINGEKLLLVANNSDVPQAFRTGKSALLGMR